MAVKKTTRKAAPKAAPAADAPGEVAPAKSAKAPAKKAAVKATPDAPAVPAVKGKAKAATTAPKDAKPNALQQPLTPSKELAVIVGKDQLPRGQVVSKVWEYIKKHDLQDAKDRRTINADSNLEPIFGKKQVTMFEMNKYLAQHLK